jgi:hypothetical protein
MNFDSFSNIAKACGLIAGRIYEQGSLASRLPSPTMLPRAVEINNLNSAGFYACNVGKIAEAMEF